MLTANTFPQWRRIFPRTVQQSTHILAKQQSQLHVASRTELARRIRARVDNGDVRPRAHTPRPRRPYVRASLGLWNSHFLQGVSNSAHLERCQTPGEVTAVAGRSLLESQTWQITAAALLGPIQSLLLPISYQSTLF